MTDAATMPLSTIALERIGDPNADACEGDSCVIPIHHEQAVVNRALDDDAV